MPPLRRAFGARRDAGIQWSMVSSPIADLIIHGRAANARVFAWRSGSSYLTVDTQTFDRCGCSKSAAERSPLRAWRRRAAPTSPVTCRRCRLRVARCPCPSPAACRVARRLSPAVVARPLWPIARRSSWSPSQFRLAIGRRSLPTLFPSPSPAALPVGLSASPHPSRQLQPRLPLSQRSGCRPYVTEGLRGRAAETCAARRFFDPDGPRMGDR